MSCSGIAARRRGGRPAGDGSLGSVEPGGPGRVRGPRAVGGRTGADDVETLLDGSAMSTVNVSEVLQRSIQHGIETEGLEYDLQGLGVDLYPFDVDQARATAELWERAPRAGLSLGDRACLSLAGGLRAVAVTTDRRWSRLDVGVSVRVIR